MIFFEKGSSKIFFIAVTVCLSAGFIFYQYFKLNPIGKVEISNLSFLPEINQVANQELPQWEYNLEMGMIELDDLKEEFRKEQERRELFKFTQQYLGEKINYQQTTSPEEEITN